MPSFLERGLCLQGAYSKLGGRSVCCREGQGDGRREQVGGRRGIRVCLHGVHRLSTPPPLGEEGPHPLSGRRADWQLGIISLCHPG